MITARAAASYKFDIGKAVSKILEQMLFCTYMLYSVPRTYRSTWLPLALSGNLRGSLNDHLLDEHLFNEHTVLSRASIVYHKVETDVSISTQ